MSGHQNPASQHRNTVIIWFNKDDRTETDTINRIRVELEQLAHFLLVSNDPHECNEFFKQIADQQFILIIDEENFGESLDKLDYSENCKTIYILSKKASIDSGFVIPNTKASLVTVDHTRLCQRIRIDLDYNNFDFNVMSKGESISVGSNNSNRQESIFVYGQMLKHIFNGMCYTNDDLDRMISYFQDECKNQPKNLQEIAEFAYNYTPTNAVWYYTRYSFLYRRLNAALRTCDVVAMYKMGIFIRDLHHQIVDIHRNTYFSDILTLYRGILMPVSVFEAKLKGKEGALLSINEFWSTSINDDVARIFAHRSSLDRDVAVLFRIKIDPSVPTSVAFANIQSITQYKDEAEYLFTMGSVFRIESIYKIEGDLLWGMSLTLTSDRDEALMDLINYTRSLILTPNVVVLCTVISMMGEHMKAVEIGETAIKSLQTDDEKFAFHYVIGQAYGAMLFSDRMLDHFKKALMYCEKFPIIIRDNPLFIIMTSFVLWFEGKIDQALSYLQHEIDRASNSPFLFDDQKFIASYHVLKSRILESYGSFSEAIIHNQEATRIYSDCMPSLHPIKAVTVGQLATLRFMTNLENVCEPMKECHEINQRTEISKDWWRATNETNLSLFENMDNSRSIYDLCPQEASVSSHPSTEDTPAKFIIRINQLLAETKYDEALSTIEEYLASQKDQSSLSNPYLFEIYFYRGFCKFHCEKISEALQDFQTVEEFASTYTSPQHPIRLMSRLYTAMIHVDQMNHHEAFRILEQIDVSELKQSGGSMGIIFRNLVKNLSSQFQIQAFICREDENENEALELFKKSLKVQLTYLPSNHPKLAETFEHIAHSYRALNDINEALANYQQAKKIWEAYSILDETEVGSATLMRSFLENSYRECLKRTGLDGTLFADIMNDNPFTYSKLLGNYRNIAEIYVLQNNVIDAIVYYHYALDVQLMHVSRTDQDAALLWMKLGKMYESIELFDDASNAFSNALQIYLSMVTPEANDLTTVYKSMGYICVDMKEYNEALLHFNECLQIEMLSVPHNVCALADTHRCIGLTLQLQGNHTDAALHLQQCFEIQERRTSRPEKSQRHTTTSHRSVALAALQERNYQKALEHLEQCLAMQLNSLPNQHLDLVDTYQLIADVMCQTHRPTDAITYYGYVIEILNKHLPRTTSQLIEIQLKLGYLYLKLHQYENSLSAYEEVLTLQLNIRSGDHLNTAEIYKQIASIEYIMGQYEDALENFENCLRMQMDALPAHHPDLLDTQSRIDGLRQDLEKLLHAPSNAESSSETLN